MSQQPSGWYEDPSDPDLLRYWDGVMWSNHTTPKKAPRSSQPTIPQAPTGSPAIPQAPAAQPPVQHGGGAWGQGASQFPQAPVNTNWMHAIATTADGVPLASWGRRLSAWLIDGVILLILIAILTQLLVPDYSRLLEQLGQAIENNDTDAITSSITQASGTIALVGLVSYLTVTIYAIAFWTWSGQTPGKMMVGISVRRVDRPGPLDLTTAIKRRLLAIVQIIPAISGVYGLLALLDGLFPLWDDKRQTLHDKIAVTQVVRGKQPRTPSHQ